MRRLIVTCLFAALATALLAGASVAPAAKRSKASKPRISKVMPMRVKAGQRVTLRGARFRATKRANTVIFRAPGGQSIIVKPRRASRGKLVVAVPTAVAMLAKSKPTRFRLRVIAGRASTYTSARLSPVVVPCPESDRDCDLLKNDYEVQVTKTDPSEPDTDKDTVEDGYEFKSALDLNDDEFQAPNQSLPFPGKRPYPNPLSDDAATDHDGDSLTLAQEQELWRYAGPRTLSTLSYSDGEQASIKRLRPDNLREPALSAANYAKHENFVGWAAANGYRTVRLSDGPPWYAHDTRTRLYGLFDINRNGSESSVELQNFDFDGDGLLQDDERDEDADGLTNFDEANGRMQRAYWTSCYQMETPFTLEYADTAFADPDSDGDGVRDGADDQDHDDIPNLMELSRYMASGLWDGEGECELAESEDEESGEGDGDEQVLNHPGAYGRVNPFNPCLPARWARTCTRHPSFEGTGAPFDDSPNWYSLN